MVEMGGIVACAGYVADGANVLDYADHVIIPSNIYYFCCCRSMPKSPFFELLLCKAWSVGGVMVSIDAFQALDPGSIPGQRRIVDNSHNFLLLLIFFGKTSNAV